MTLMIWSPRYQLGYPRIDDEHQVLFSLLSQLQDSLFQPDSDAHALAIVTELEAYAQYHFSTEEGLMELHQYPHLRSHIRQHRNFVEELTEHRRRIENGDYAGVVGLLNFVRQWLSTHILQTDNRFVRFLQRADTGV